MSGGERARPLGDLPVTTIQTWERVSLASNRRCWACHDRFSLTEEAWECRETKLVLCGYCFLVLREGPAA